MPRIAAPETFATPATTTLTEEKKAETASEMTSAARTLFLKVARTIKERIHQYVK